MKAILSSFALVFPLKKVATSPPFAMGETPQERCQEAWLSREWRAAKSRWIAGQLHQGKAQWPCSQLMRLEPLSVKGL